MKTNNTPGIVKKIHSVVNKHYDIGNISGIKELHSGTVNRTFILNTAKNRHHENYVIRKYSPYASETGIRYEHSFLTHLKQNGFDLAAGIIDSKYGKTFVKEQSPVKNTNKIEFWAIYEFIYGEDRYTWKDTHLQPEELESAASVFALLHKAGHNFIIPPHAYPTNPTILNLLPTLSQSYTDYVNNAGRTSFDQCFLKNRAYLIKKIDCVHVHVSDFMNMIQIPIHGDFHPGNLKYNGLKVAGVFDFDWSNIDFRLFDIAVALALFCTCWDAPNSGVIDVEKYRLFLRSYNQRISADKKPGSLTKIEINYLPLMLTVANLYELSVIIKYFYAADNPSLVNEKYLSLLIHFLKRLHWLDTNQNKIVEAIYLSII